MASACESAPNEPNSSKSEDEVISEKQKALPTKSSFLEFFPIEIDDLEVEGYDIDVAFQLDSLVFFSGYTPGDMNTSPNPTNWGDRLVMMKRDKILFESKGVGDPYLYEPHFYRNSTNGKVIIICQLGFEYKFGGDAFLLENGQITSIGNIDVETPYEIENRDCLTKIVQLSELNDTIFFQFDLDTIIYRPSTETVWMKNDNIHYTYTGGKLELEGI